MLLLPLALLAWLFLLYTVSFAEATVDAESNVTCIFALTAMLLLLEIAKAKAVVGVFTGAAVVAEAILVTAEGAPTTVTMTVVGAEVGPT